MQSNAKTLINNDSGKIIKVQCIECRNITNHKILANSEFSDSEGYVSWKTDYQIIQCQGCDCHSFRSTHTNSEDIDQYYDENGDQISEYIETVEIYPPRVSDHDGLGDEIYQLPCTLQRIYKETTDALHSNLPVLTAIGVRAILEALCKERKAEGRNLQLKIKSLVDQQLLTSQRADILHKIRSLGNGAAHEATPHSEAQLKLAMRVIDHLLQEIYILPSKADKVFKSAEVISPPPIVLSPPTE